MGESKKMAQHVDPAEAPVSAQGPVPSQRTPGLLRGLGELAHRRPRRLLAGTAAFFVIAAVFGAPVAGLLKSRDDFVDPSSESIVMRKQLERAAGTESAPGLIALVRTRGSVDRPAARAKVERVAEVMKRNPLIGQTLTFYETGSRDFVSRDRTATFVAGVFKNAGEDEIDKAAVGLGDELKRLPGVTVGGSALVGETIGSQVGEDLGKAEAIAFPLLFLASLVIFRGLVAALLPLFVGVVTIFGTFLALRLVNEVTSLSIFALNLVIALGLGLAIDYSLFILSRYREELARSGPGVEAFRRTLETAGRTILFSALTVAAALASLTIFPQRFLFSMGVGGVLCTLVALATALIALPALLALLGPRVNALPLGRWGHTAERSAREESTGFWYRLSRAVMRRPLLAAGATAAVLIAAGIPFLRVEFTGIDARVLPEATEARQVHDALRAEFPASRAEEMSLGVRAPPGAERELREYAGELRSVPGVERVEPPRRAAAQLWEINVLPRHPSLDDRTLDLVREIRDRPTPFPVGVTGESAEFVDQLASLGNRLPVALALLCLATVLALFAMTGSIVLPIKSLLMNALSLSATFGLLVLIFQDGRFEGLLDFTSQGALEASQPILLFALAFGLSTDYAVFLLSRIKEARDGGTSDNEAVAVGLQRTGRIVTAAALLFSIAVGAFATSEIIFIKQVGVGTAIAVLIDATIIRAVLVPSLMVLLGRRNWWAPAPLRRLHARLGIREAG